MNYCLICGLPLGRKRKCHRCEEERNKPKGGDCEYCVSIYNTTLASPRRKYEYCPMCGKRLDKEKFKIWMYTKLDLGGADDVGNGNV